MEDKWRKKNILQDYVDEGLREMGDLPPLEDADFEIIEPKQIENTTTKTDKDGTDSNNE